MSLPNYMFLGASKSATTTFYDILKKHKDIFAPRFKEPHFFNIDENFSKGIDWYEKTYFNDVQNEKVIIDFTPTYLYSNLCAERIYKSLGSKMKFIIVLRDPVNRAYSHYNHSVRDGHENHDFKKALGLEFQRIQEFKDKDDFLSELRCSYISQGLYCNMLKSYLRFYDLENFLIINFDKEVVSNMGQTINKLSNFLNVDLSNLNIKVHSNKSGKFKYKLLQDLMLNDNFLRKFFKIFVPQISRQLIRNKIKNFNKEEFNHGLLSDDQRKVIFEKYFNDDIKKLEILIGEKMNWNKQ